MPPGSSPPSSDLQLGAISAFLAGLGLLITTVGCIGSMPYMGMPFAIMAMVVAVMDVQKARAGEPRDLTWSIVGLVLGTLALAVNVLMFAACGMFVFGYFAIIVGMVLAL